MDGRRYPWGDGFDPSWACMEESHRGRPTPTVVDTFPIDEGPYGLRGVAGNSLDWCADGFTPDGPALAGAEVLPPLDGGDPSPGLHRPIRGGGWFTNAEDLGIPIRRHLDGSFRGFDIGFRLARTLDTGASG